MIEDYIHYVFAFEFNHVGSPEILLILFILVESSGQR